MTSGEVFVVPKNGQGHLFPSMELCKHLLMLNYKITLVIDSDISSSVPPSLLQSPLFHIAHISSSPSPSPVPGSDPRPPHHPQIALGLEAFLASRRSEDPCPARPICAVIDHIMNKTQQVFWKFNIPTVIFITSGACWAAIQHAAWKVRPADMTPGEVRILPGLPEEIVLTYSDLKQRRHWLPPQFRSDGTGTGPDQFQRGGISKKPRMGPPFPGEPAPWVAEVKSSAAILINTCDDLERTFLDYIANLTGKPVWGVGPLLPLQNREFRPTRESNYTTDEIIEWLDSKPRGSVMYISFGSEVGPSMEEYPELAAGLEESDRPFIWVIQRNASRPGPVHDSQFYFPEGLERKVGKRGMVIYGWAPQLVILSHPSTGGFVSHCGWNSTVEALTRGVPILGWPIRGDQYYNAKLVVSYLKVGRMVSDGYPADLVKKKDIIDGIESLVRDEDIKNRSAAISAKFEHGFPASSVASLDAFRDFINCESAKLKQNKELCADT